MAYIFETPYSRVVDDDIFHEMTVLEKAIEYHENEWFAKGKRHALRLPIPSEISPVVARSIHTDWINRNYDMVRVAWAEAWMLYYHSYHNMKPAYDANTYAGYSSDGER